MQRFFPLVVVLGLLSASGRLSAGSSPDALLKTLRDLSVQRTGEVAGVGESAAFPKKSAKGIEFSVPVKEGTHRLDGSLQLARSQSGLQLWSLRKWDDGTDDANLFTVRLNDSGKLPPGAVLQFVDGVWESVSPELLGTFGRRVTKELNGGATELFLEAWVALPDQRLIYSPADKKTYPLVPARGSYDPAAALRVQWTVFSRMCSEIMGPCVYFGTASDVCRRHRETTKKGALWIAPYECRL